MPLPKENRTYSIQDIYDLPEGTRAELVDGQIYYLASPSRVHQEVLMELAGTIRDYIRSKDGPCKVYPAPFAVFLNKDDKIYLEPDISIICDPDKLDDRGCNGVPDWIIEIASPNNKMRDHVEKLYLYQTTGVREYWIVDPQAQKILVYFFESDSIIGYYTFKDKIKVNIYDDLEIDFSEIDI